MKKSIKQFLSIALVLAMSLSVLYFAPAKKADAAWETFIIDPGHGGYDPGATNGNRQEKDDTLSMSLKVGAIVSQYASVTYTRTTDVYLSLNDRCVIANNNGNSYFISIHRNSFSASAYGLETFYCSNLSASSTSAKFATAVQNEVLGATTFYNRGVKTALFTVITGTNMPACLVELGFISNANDNAIYDTYNDAIAQAIATAMLSMINVDIGSDTPITPSVTKTNKLEGNSAVDMGKDFYARVEHPSSGKYLADVGFDVKACDFSDGNEQVWHFMRQASGAYLIGNASTSKFWNVQDASYENGTNLETSSATFESNQKFFIYHINGYFYFMPEGGDRTIDIDAPTLNAQIYGSETGGFGSTEHNARSFDLEILSIYDGGTAVSDLGDSFTATIKNSSSGKFLTASNGNLVAQNVTNTDNQKWNFTRLPNGAYTIVSVSEGTSVDVYNTLLSEGTSVDLYTLHGGNAQTFFLLERNGAYYIKSTYTLNSLTMDTTNFDFYMYTTDEGKTATQTFEIIPVSDADEEMLALKSDSGFGKDGSILTNVKPSMTADEVLANFENTNTIICDSKGNELISDQKVGTGCTVDLVVNGQKIDSLTIVIKGEITGEGAIDSTDYLKIKGNFLGEYTLDAIFTIAADIDNNGRIDSSDYIQVKSHFLGTTNIHQ